MLMFCKAQRRKEEHDRRVQEAVKKVVVVLYELRGVMLSWLQAQEQIQKSPAEKEVCLMSACMLLLR